MAITKAQQYRQMLEEGGILVSPSINGKRKGYRFGFDRGKETSPDPGADTGDGPAQGGPDREGNQNQFEINRKAKLQQEAKKIADQKAADAREQARLKSLEDFKKNKRKQELLEQARQFREEQRKKRELAEKGRKGTNIFGNIVKSIFPIATSAISSITNSGIVKNLNAAQRQAFLDSLDLTDPEEKAVYDRVMNQLGGLGMDIIAGPKDLKDTKLSVPPSMLATNPMTKFKTVDGVSSLGDPGVKDVLGQEYQDYLNRFEPDGSGGDGPDNQIIPQVVPTTTAPTTTTTTSDEDVDDIFKGELAARFGGSLFDFDKLRANAMDGGIMNTDVIGGFADDSMDEMGRQMYGLGKLVKKVTRGVKKIAKSPIGKAALLYFGGNALTGGGLKSFLLGSNAGPSFSKTGILKKMFLKNPSLGFSLGNISPVAGIFGTSALAGLMTPKQEEENEEQYLGPSFDAPIPAIRARRRLAPAFDGSTYNYELADGGRIGYQDGSKEPVAKKTMPLIDMDGMEKDYRETGGFVEMGRMERADDVPARLSKNEFVFTADAVRNAGDGNVDKGAEVMYNMMKNLESGGEVSEESQGLEGARKMFQTSQRLGEVI